MAFSDDRIETGECSGRWSERFCFDPQLLEHADKEITQRWWVLGIEMKMPAMPETATSEENG